MFCLEIHINITQSLQYMPRKSPVRHHVNSYRKKKANVTDHNRGSGHRSVSVTELKVRQKKGTVDEHGRNLKKIGEDISYLDNGRRVSGIVVGIRAEYYLVERNGKIWRVDRHSVFTRVGSALTGAGAKLLSVGKVGLKATVAKAKALDGARIKGALKKGAGGLKASAVKGAAAVGAELERRRDERENWREWKEEMEVEEKAVLKRREFKAKGERERKKFRAKIRKGPLWKRSARIIRQIVSDETKAATKRSKMRALEASLGKKQARAAVKRFRAAEKKEMRQRLGRSY